MNPFENPILLAKQVSDLHRAAAHWQHRLRCGEIDETGPFIGRPAFTERETFDSIREIAEPEPVKLAWSRWAFRLADVRVNAPLQAYLAQAYRVTQHKIEQPERMQASLAQLLRRVLERHDERSIWVAPLAEQSARVGELAVQIVIRRDEIARRAGFANAEELVAPTNDLKRLIERMLASTEEVYREIVPSQFDRWLDAALGIGAPRGWPAQLTPRSIQDLLGSHAWVDGLDLKARLLPSGIAATSFARALQQLGITIAQAAAPKSEPFIIAHDPFALHPHALGALFANLTTSVAWQKHRLSLSQAQAEEQARALRLSQLIYVRTLALAVLLYDRARSGREAIARDYEEVCHHVIGLSPPRGLAAVMPRLRVDAGQRLVAQWLATEWARHLVSEFDEDWFRNPRGIEAVRDRISRVLPVTVTHDELTGCIETFAIDCSRAL